MKPVAHVTEAVAKKAADMLSKPLGHKERVTLDGIEYEFRVETHTWYGANPSKPHAPHKGVTVYEVEDGDELHRCCSCKHKDISWTESPCAECDVGVRPDFTSDRDKWERR